MYVDVITNPQVWLTLRKNWETVYDADPDAQYFLSWDWIDRRLMTGPGQWFVLAVKEKEQDIEYVAFFPFKMRTRYGEKALFWQDVLVAGSPASDYTGLLCLPRFEGRAIPALAEALLARRWAKLVLNCFRVSRKRLRLFTKCFATSDFHVADYEDAEPDGVNNWVCPYISLPDDWDAYLETLSANTRQKVRRFLRKVEGSDTYRITYADAETVERDIAILVDFWGRRWIEEKGQATAAIQESLKEILMDVFRSGTLILPILWQGERPLVALSFFIDKKTNSLLFYAAGRDLEFKELPAGLTLHAHCIRDAIAHGYKVYEFLRGDEPYKLSFASEQRRMRNIIITTKTPGNWGGAIDPIAIPVVFRQIQHFAAEGNVIDAERGCRQILQSEPLHAGARALFRKLNEARIRRQQAMMQAGAAPAPTRK
jgi:CelD/BcsL family acetyltransferase involved in cellulose biosynthesis